MTCLFKRNVYKRRQGRRTLEINCADVQGVLQNVRPKFIGSGVVAVVAVTAIIACLKMAKPTKFLIRCKQERTIVEPPAAINNNFTRVGSVGFSCSVMIACTWSQQIAHDFGGSIGIMADEMGVSSWYVPAMNTHRSAFAGRNFEYYSEDGYLSSAIASNAVSGVREHGVYAYMKHFVLNDTEDRRNDMICVWVNEQAIREIYLKPFELAVKGGGADAVMSSFNYIGTEWAGGNNALCNTVLRGEWGFRGMVLTDYFGVYGYMNSDQAIRNGTDFCLVAYDESTNHVVDTASATGVLAMRQASKNILYTVVNSRAYDPANLNTGLAGWQIAAIVIDVVLAVVIIALEVLTIKGHNKRKADHNTVGI